MVKSDQDFFRKIWPSALLVVAIIVGYKLLSSIPSWIFAGVLIALLAFALRSWVAK